MFLWHAIASATLVCCAGIIGVSAYWSLLDTEPPFRSTKVATYDLNGIQQTRFRAGSVVMVERDFCAEKDVLVNVVRLWRGLSGNAIFMGQEGNVVIRAGCVESRNSVFLSSLMPMGEYAYETTVTYQNNPLYIGAVRLPVPIIEVVR